MRTMTATMRPFRFLSPSLPSSPPSALSGHCLVNPSTVYSSRRHPLSDRARRSRASMVFLWSFPAIVTHFYRISGAGSILCCISKTSVRWSILPVDGREVIIVPMLCQSHTHRDCLLQTKKIPARRQHNIVSLNNSLRWSDLSTDEHRVDFQFRHLVSAS